MSDPAASATLALSPPGRLGRRFVGASLVVSAFVVLGLAASAWGSHGRGTTLSASVAPDGSATIILVDRVHRTGGCTPGEMTGGAEVVLHGLDGPLGSRTPVREYIVSTVCYRSAGDFVESRAEIVIPAADIPDGWYVVRHVGNAKVGNITNVNKGASQTNWSSEAKFRKVTGTATGSPTFGVDLPFGMSIGHTYSQNLAVTDPDGGTVTTRTMCCNPGNPDFAVSKDVIQVTEDGLVPDNQIVIPTDVTSDVPVGAYVEFKVRVTDDDGEYSELDMVLSPTENDPPVLAPPDGRTTYGVTAGTPTRIPLEASDPDPGQNVSFSLSGQPEWVTLTQTPGNPGRGEIAITPPPTVSGTFVINVNANDDDPVLQSTSSFTLTIVVEGVPDVPRNVAATQGPDGVTVTWEPPTDTGTPVTGYRVEHREAGSGVAYTAVDGATSPTVIPGLGSGRTYEIRVVALSANGDGIPATTSIRPTSAAGPVQSLQVQPTPTGAAVAWTPPASDGGTPVQAYLVEHRRSGAAAWVSAGEVTEASATLTGLDRGVAYEVRVRAVTGVGPGEPAVQSFRTLALPRAGSSSVVVIIDGEPVRAPLPTGMPAGSLVSVAATPSGAGSWAVTADGVVYAAGDAADHGDLAELGVRPNASITGITPTVTGQGYYLVAEDGGVFAFGDARFFGSMGAIPLNQPVQAIVPTCSNDGYYLVALDGGVFTFGDALFHGSMAGTNLNRGMLGIVSDCARNGYWTFAADGGVFTFGDIGFYGSLGGNPPPAGVVAMTGMPDNRGYWLVGGDGSVHPFGSAAD